MEKSDPVSKIKTSRFSNISVKGPTRYRIVVGKPLSPTWSDRLAGLVITPDSEATSSTTTTCLEGVIQDQAQLSGVLNTLYDMGLPLLSVEAVED